MLTITLPQLKREIRLAQMLAKMAKGKGEKIASPRALQRLKTVSQGKANSEG